MIQTLLGLLLILISLLIYVPSRGEVDIIELPRQHSICQADERDANTKDGDDVEKEEFNDDVETKSDEDVINFLNNEVSSVLCLYTFFILCIYIFQCYVCAKCVY